MATEEFIKRSIISAKPYDALPSRIKAVVSLSDWKFRVKEHCIQRGYSWVDSLAKTASSEGEYYEDLLEFYMQNYRIYPYHLADYISRIMRVSPFKYNSDLLYAVIREEKSYDFLPNFTAADIVRLVGVGRNEYIAIMNKCKAKKLLWRVNRSVARELLPSQPLDIQMQPWWHVNVVNLGETEYRQLQPAELQICQDACRPGGLTVGEVGQDALQPLYKQGLIYLSVPILPSDHISIPPLEGFVSNKDSEKGEDKGDPLEAVLYGVFVATSERASVAQLASILSVDQARLQAAVSVACLLGFANRLPPGNEADEAATRDNVEGWAQGEGAQDSSRRGSETQEGSGEGGGGQGIALVVDAEVTSYLMMGALSPGLKRHSVTLFEGGRVTGSHIISDLIQELHASVEAASQFEGEMQMLAGYSRALATALECLQAAGGGRPLELLRKEPLANLAPAAARRVLSHAYAAVVPITPLPSPPLPLTPHQPGPTNFGATLEASTPWLQLALYRAARSSPASLVFTCGQRFWRLPPQLKACTHALFWPWDPTSVRAQGLPILVDIDFLLFSLNEHLSRTALVVQPVAIPPSATIGELPIASLALPLSQTGETTQGVATVYSSPGGQEMSVQVAPSVLEAVASLGLSHAVGCLQLMQVAFPDAEDGTEGSSEDGGTWVPLTLQLGLPLQPDPLCQAVCKAAAEIDFLGQEARTKHARGQLLLQDHIGSLTSEFGSAPPAALEGSREERQSRLELPAVNLLVEGGEFQLLDLREYLQGAVAV